MSSGRADSGAEIYTNLHYILAFYVIGSRTSVLPAISCRPVRSTARRNAYLSHQREIVERLLPSAMAAADDRPWLLHTVTRGRCCCDYCRGCCGRGGPDCSCCGRYVSTGDTWTVGLLLRGRVDLAFTDGGRRHQARAATATAATAVRRPPSPPPPSSATATVSRGRCAAFGSSRRPRRTVIFRSVPTGFVSRARSPPYTHAITTTRPRPLCGVATCHVRDGPAHK